MEATQQNTAQFTEENDVIKQFMELLNRQNMGEQSQDFMELFKYVAGMQLQLSVMVDELQGVREQLSRMQENQPKSVREKLDGQGGAPSGENHRLIGAPVSSKRPFGGNSGAGGQRL